MYLRNFADEHNRLRLVDRDTLTRTLLSSVKRACNEVGFYEWRPGLAMEEVDDPAVLDPEHIEGLLSVFEGRATAAIGRILTSGHPPRTKEDRYDLVHFVALQTARGRRFRDDLSQVATWAARRHMRETVSYEQAAQWLRERGRSHTRADVEAFLDRVLGPGGPTLIPDKTFAIQQALRFAYLDVAPRLWTRRWHVVQFDQPALLTSDEPVVAWHPDNEPVTAVTAPIVWLPLSRRHVLEIRDDAHGDGTSRRGRPEEAHRINSLAATQAEQWIIHHPDDQVLLTRLNLGPHTSWAEETIARRVDGDTIRETRRVRRLPQQP